MRRFVRTLILLVLCGGLARVHLKAQELSIQTELFPPYQFLGADGRLTGFSVELVREIQARTGGKDPIQVVPWVRGYNEALTRPNVVLFSMARIPERDALFKWVGPLSETSIVLYVKSGSRTVIKDLEDARKLHLVGVYKADVREQFLSQAGFTNLDRSPDQATMLKKLMGGRIAALASTPEAIFEIARIEGYRAEDLRAAFTLDHWPVYIAFSKGTPDGIVRAWSRALEAMKADGFVDRLRARYGPGIHPAPQ